MPQEGLGRSPLARRCIKLASIEVILIIAPWIVLVGAYGLLVLATRMAGGETPSGREVLDSFWEQPRASSET